LLDEVVEESSHLHVDSFHGIIVAERIFDLH
jgi:hypothetical protein